jgi:hypothetical protein
MNIPCIISSKCAGYFGKINRQAKSCDSAVEVRWLLRQWWTSGGRGEKADFENTERVKQSAGTEKLKIGSNTF